MDVYGSRANWAEEAASTLPFLIPIRNRRPEGERPHVLIVEDNELVTGALRIIFEETGHRVSVGHSVAEAITIGSNDAPHLLLLDLSLPDGDGLEVLLALTSSGIKPKATVAITGSDDQSSIERCSKAGCTAVMVKPVSTSELLRKSREWLGDFPPQGEAQTETPRR